jgi:hypothetical protein
MDCRLGSGSESINLGTLFDKNLAKGGLPGARFDGIGSANAIYDLTLRACNKMNETAKNAKEFSADCCLP